jgi:hypothetical protein
MSSNLTKWHQSSRYCAVQIILELQTIPKVISKVLVSIHSEIPPPLEGGGWGEGMQYDFNCIFLFQDVTRAHSK